jgi:hypothetical protein
MKVAMTLQKEIRLFGPDSQSYGSDYLEHLLEQYKIYVEMVDRVSARRATANTFFLTTNTVVLSALGIFGRAFVQEGYLGVIASVIVLSGAIIFCRSWRLLLSSYNQLSTAKFQVIHEIEKKLPAAPYDYEWEKLGRGNDPKKYRPLTTLEKHVPTSFIFAYCGLTAIWIISAVFH